MSCVVLLGLIVVADAMICLASPSRLLTSYGRLVAGWREPRIPTPAAVAMRIAAAVAIVVAGFVAFQLNVSAWDVGAVLVFGAFGVAGKIFGWNRLVLILALVVGTVLEESIRRTMLLSAGDPMIFLERPITAILTIAAGLVLAAAALLSIRRVVA